MWINLFPGSFAGMAHWTWLRYATIFNRKTSFLGKFQSFWIFGMPLSSTENLFFGNILEYLVSHYFQQKTCFGEISEFLVFLAGLSLNFSRGDLLGQYSKSIFKKCFSCFDKGLAWGRKVVFSQPPLDYILSIFDSVVSINCGRL